MPSSWMLMYVVHNDHCFLKGYFNYLSISIQWQQVRQMLAILLWTEPQFSGHPSSSIVIIMRESYQNKFFPLIVTFKTSFCGLSHDCMSYRVKSNETDWSPFPDPYNTIFYQLMLSWKTHIDQLIIKLSTACYVIRSLKPYMSHKTLSSIYHSLFHSVMSYEIIFWRNSYDSIKMFRMQKKSN
jgi:hypothetical protein